ncbi:hypothetical protein [Methylocapsa aurea]|uniref:hypothetical protein n=1 Tax=Methylocapsa aurea TaxID=663610 RepID=UPI0005639646|nr:hypothetical protein [Methylocapsa aurea]
MEPSNFGIESVGEEDRRYAGSRFAEVRDAIFANPYQDVWGRDGEPPLPNYETTLSSVLRGILPFGQPYLFRQASERAVDSHADLRWGPDGKGFRRLVHPNGVCLTGLWEITEETEYSGYFGKDRQALVVGRYSSRLLQRGETRSLSLVGKLFPTTDPNHAAPLRTASIFSQEDIGGDHTEYINDAELRNAPDVTPWRQGKGLPILLVSGIVFTLADKQSTVRQVYQVAELGKPPREPTRAPAFMRLLVAPDQPRIEGENLDFRDEVMAQIFDKGDPIPKRKLTFHIEVTDEGATRDILGFVRRTFKNWRRIGRLTFDDAVISYNGDFVIHFNHPGWRADRNDPATANRRPLTRE